MPPLESKREVQADDTAADDQEVSAFHAASLRQSDWETIDARTQLECPLARDVARAGRAAKPHAHTGLQKGDTPRALGMRSSLPSLWRGMLPTSDTPTFGLH